MENLESWLRSKNMSTVDFAKILGCSRQVLWKVKLDIPISPKIACKIFALTDGKVQPASRPVGGQRS